MTLEYILASQEAAGRAEQARQSGAQRATSSMEFITDGSGEAVLAFEPFDTQFLERPSMTTGFEIIKAPDPAYYRMPRVTAGIRRVATSVAANGATLFTHASLFVAVDVDLANPDTVTQEELDANPLRCKLRHFVEFRGLSFKNFGATDAAAKFDDANFDAQPWSIAQTNREYSPLTTGFVLGGQG